MMRRIFKFVFLCFVIYISFFMQTSNKSNSSEAVDIADVNITDRIPVLTFHRLVPDDVKKDVYKDNQWVGSVDVFAEMMQYLYVNGYKTISTEDFYYWYIGDREYDNKTVLITFDDGFYEDYYLALPILKKYNFKATSFVVGSRIKPITRVYDKYKTSFLGLDVIEKVREEYPNFEFQSHSFNMHYYTKNNKHRIKSMSYDELEADVVSNEKYEFTTMAYPYGDYNNSIKEILKKHNYLVAFKFGGSDYATREDDQYAIPRIKINGNATINTLIKWIEY